MTVTKQTENQVTSQMEYTNDFAPEWSIRISYENSVETWTVDGTFVISTNDADLEDYLATGDHGYCKNDAGVVTQYTPHLNNKKHKGFITTMIRLPAGYKRRS